MDGVHVAGPAVEGEELVLTDGALAFVADLVRTFRPRRDELLALRTVRREEYSAAGGPNFLTETEGVRQDPSWRCAEAPAALRDRRVEITGPTDAKMAVNALNAGAKVWLADLEDANTPHWRNVVGGQVTLWHVARRSLEFTQADGKHYALNPESATTTVVRPRGWHLDERHVQVDGAPAVGALVDFGLHFFHNAHQLVEREAGPYYYLPKMESYLEARLWDEVFTYAQEKLGIPVGTVRATVLIETLPAVFQMEEILYELRRHISGLNAGRWDYLFSAIKTLRDAGPRFVLPDRASVSMTAPFMRAYTELLVSTCHRRGAFAMGGMAAFIPSRRDAEVNERAFAQVRADKEREAGDGFDGSWVAHPDLVPVALAVFDAQLGERPNQLDRLRDDVWVERDDLLNFAATPGEVTEAGLRVNVSVALQYLGAWLDGLGAVAIHNLMEDAATAEISRSQLWQWLRYGTVLDSGAVVTQELVEKVLAQEAAALTGTTPHLEEARALFAKVALDEEFADFLTLPAYDLID
ncbi:malate synthase A [Spongisporangium articulatum]|uniref:malate synthase n=1 Tax=Spongisporangium articulatum TaxID=3362603 RepID=A0ABW8AJ67_9ACTN